MDLVAALEAVLAEHGEPDALGTPPARGRFRPAGSLLVRDEVMLRPFEGWGEWLTFDELRPGRYDAYLAHARPAADEPSIVTAVALVAPHATAETIAGADYAERCDDATMQGETLSAVTGCAADLGLRRFAEDFAVETAAVRAAAEQKYAGADPAYVEQAVTDHLEAELRNLLDAQEARGNPAPVLDLTLDRDGANALVFRVNSLGCQSILLGTDAGGEAVCLLWSVFDD
ncbi:hypothetical protein [Kitasatospora sp. LaBMicrA B282]|uniref:hypothetical protein n=1 Tax=Kitasatospora sp. LaBMicrA B282 TaxID=3420949 RepID=UPI003D0C5807